VLGAVFLVLVEVDAFGRDGRAGRVAANAGAVLQQRGSGVRILVAIEERVRSEPVRTLLEGVAGQAGFAARPLLPVIALRCEGVVARMALRAIAKVLREADLAEIVLRGIEAPDDQGLAALAGVLAGPEQ